MHMKKFMTKLMLKRETLRTLDRMQLVHEISSMVEGLVLGNV